MLRSLFTRSRRYVLIIGNAGAVLSYIVRGQVHARWSVSSADAESLRAIAEALNKRRGAPLTVLFDILEQSYRREAIPPVGVMDRPKVLKRRLTIAYPNFDIKAALALDEKVGPRGDLAYLLVALPSSELLESWIAFLHSVANTIDRLGLLPIESTGLATALASAAREADAEPGEWTLLISRERTGGFRQIIVRGGKLVMTRLTPDPTGPVDASQIAATIEQETTSTLGYLTRLGYTAAKGLDVVVLGPESLRDAIGASRLPVRSMAVLTPTEAGDLLGLGNVADADEEFGDLVHAAWAVKQWKPVLQMAAAALGQRQVQIVATRRWVTVGLSATAVLLTAYCGYLGYEVWTLHDEIAPGDRVHQRLIRNFDELKRRIAEYPEQPKKVTATLDFYDDLNAISLDPALDLAAIEDSLGPDLRLKSLVWKSEQFSIVAQRKGAAKQRKDGSSPRFTLAVNIDLATISEPEAAIAATNALAERLREQFEESLVEIIRLPIDILPNQTFVGFSSRTVEPVEPVAPGEFSAEITISGKAQ